MNSAQLRAPRSPLISDNGNLIRDYLSHNTYKPSSHQVATDNFILLKNVALVQDTIVWSKFAKVILWFIYKWTTYKSSLNNKRCPILLDTLWKTLVVYSINNNFKCSSKGIELKWAAFKVKTEIVQTRLCFMGKKTEKKQKTCINLSSLETGVKTVYYPL